MSWRSTVMAYDGMVHDAVDGYGGRLILDCEIERATGSVAAAGRPRLQIPADVGTQVWPCGDDG